MQRREKEISVVVPTLNNPAGTIQLVNHLNRVFVNRKITAEILLIDDASSLINRTHLIAELQGCKITARIKLILLSTRCGQFVSTRYGISFSEGKFILTLDDDKFISEQSVMILVEKIQDSNLDFIVGTNSSEKKENILRHIGSFMTQKIGRYVYKTPKNHVFSSTILFRAESIIDIARSNQYATRPGWFYQVSNFYTNQSIDLADNVRKSNYKMLSLAKSFLNVSKLLNQNFYMVLAKVSLPIIFFLFAFTVIFTRSISSAPTGYLSLFLLLVAIIFLLLLVNFQLATVAKKQINNRENLISFRVINF